MLYFPPFSSRLNTCYQSVSFKWEERKGFFVWRWSDEANRDWSGETDGLIKLQKLGKQQLPPKRGHKFRAPCPTGLLIRCFSFNTKTISVRNTPRVWFQVSFFSGIAERATHAWASGKRIDYHPQGSKRRGGRGDVPRVRTYFFKAMSTLSSLKNLTRKLEVTDENRPTAKQLKANVGFFNNDLMTACSRSPLSLLPLPLFFLLLLPTRLFRAILHYLSLWCRLAPLRNCITPGFTLMIQYKDFLIRNKIISVL